ncbi:MAG: hypothetical protein OEZ34_13025 [Spirochaetia bacterium]|nr:hypothetical protein [Spirochaetia bacterium]
MKSFYNISAFIAACLSFFSAASVFSCTVCVGGFTQEKIDAYFYTGLTLTALPIFILAAFFLLIQYYKKKNNRS